MKRWIGVDLDGTLAVHYWPKDGPYDHTRIGAPVPAMVERIKTWLGEGIQVKIFTARVGPQPDPHKGKEALFAIDAWMLQHFGFVLPVTAIKDSGMIELWDDRAVRVLTDTGHRCCESGSQGEMMSRAGHN